MSDTGTVNGLVEEVTAYVVELQAENTKLREYAKLMHGHIKECCDACGERGICDVDALTRSLGIEVNG